MEKPEFHNEYREYLVDCVAMELISRKGKSKISFDEVWRTVKFINRCRFLDEITPQEAQDLNSLIFELYPEYEEKINEKLAEKPEGISLK